MLYYQERLYPLNLLRNILNCYVATVNQFPQFCIEFLIISVVNLLNLHTYVGPAMRLLHEIVVPRIAADWSIVADYLEYEVEYKRVIKKSVKMIQ